MLFYNIKSDLKDSIFLAFWSVFKAILNYFDENKTILVLKKAKLQRA